MTVEEKRIEARREYQRRYREKNRERINKRAREWRRNNPDKVREINNRYWDKKVQEFKEEKEGESE